MPNHVWFLAHVGAAVHDGSSLLKATYAYRWNEITDRNAGLSTSSITNSPPFEKRLKLLPKNGRGKAEIEPSQIECVDTS